MKKNKFFFKSFFVFLLLLFFLLSFILSIFVFNNELRRKILTGIVPVYNIYQNLAIRAEIRNRDFEAINKRLISQIDLSKKFSNTRSSFINGIFDNFSIAYGQAIFSKEFLLLKKSTEELLTIDPEMYMAYVWLAQANSTGEKSIDKTLKSLEYIDKAIQLSSAREEAYRIGLKIAIENYQNKVENSEHNLDSKIKNLCNKYYNSQLGGPNARSYNNFFGGTGLRKLGIIFEDKNGNEKIITNFGLQLNKVLEYEFNFDKKTNLDSFKLIIGSLPGLKIKIDKIKLDLGTKIITLKNDDFILNSKSAYFLDATNNSNTLISNGIDDEIIFFQLYEKIRNIETIILEMNFVRLPLTKNNLCNSFY